MKLYGHPASTTSRMIMQFAADKVDSPAYPEERKARARVKEMMDWFNANLCKDVGYGRVCSQTFPHHKHPSEAVQSGTIARSKQKTQAWPKVHEVIDGFAASMKDKQFVAL